jgi:hypothetical protein
MSEREPIMPGGSPESAAPPDSTASPESTAPPESTVPQGGPGPPQLDSGEEGFWSTYWERFRRQQVDDPVADRREGMWDRFRRQEVDAPVGWPAR